MKKLELNQMEIINGGGNCNGGLEAIGAGLSGSSVILSAGMVFAAATPAGWLGLGIAALGFGITLALCD